MEEKTISHMNSLLVRFAACSRVHETCRFCELARIVQHLSEQRVGVEKERRRIWMSRTHAVDKRAKLDIEGFNVSGFCSLI